MNRLALILPTLAGALIAGTLYAGAQTSTPPKATSDQAPELIGDTWINTKDGKPITFASRKGKPTLVAFWTFACSNCQANYPAYRRLLAKYRSKGVELISVHTPEIKIEKDIEEVKKRITKEKIDYPVVIDNDYTNWKRWNVQVWPTLYVVDAKGVVKCRWLGELNWQGAGGEDKIAKVLDELLAEKPKN